MRSFVFALEWLVLAFIGLYLEPVRSADLTPIDRFLIFEQLQLHQHYIDNDASLASAQKYVSLYWPEASFTVIDPDRRTTFQGPDELKMNYDFAHSVFPLYQWAHSMGPFEITGQDNTAYVSWRWRVDWKANTTGVVSTGTYSDTFEKRNDIWKVLNRTSEDDPNWPLYLFSPYSALANQTFRPS